MDETKDVTLSQSTIDVLARTVLSLYLQTMSKTSAAAYDTPLYSEPSHVKTEERRNA